MASIRLDDYEDEDEYGSGDDEFDGAYGGASSGGGASSRAAHEPEERGEEASLPSELKGLRACMVCTLVRQT